MSTRKGANKINSESPTPDSQGIKFVQSENESDPTTPTSFDSRKKRKPKSTSSSPSISTQIQKTNDDDMNKNNEEIEELKNLNKISPKNDKEDRTLNDSPARSRKRKVYNKTAIVTRKSALELMNNTKRTLRRTRRNSNNKITNKDTDVLSKRKSFKKTTNDNIISPLKRKRTDSTRSEDKDDEKRPTKYLKVTKTDDLSQIKKNSTEKIKEYQINGDFIKNEKLILTNDNCEAVDSDDNSEDKIVLYQIISESPIKTKIDISKKSDTITEKNRRGRPRKTSSTLSDTKYSKEEIFDEQNASVDFGLLVDDSTDIPPSSLNLDLDIDDDKNTNNKLINKDILSIDTSISNNIKHDDINGAQSPITTDSFSPESEDLNVISVKQFYKQPEFLENNLGIENDPKLGEIVQEVENSPVTTIKILDNLTDTHFNNEEAECNTSDSLKECETLILEDSTEDEQSIIKTPSIKLEENDLNQLQIDSFEYNQVLLNITTDISDKNNKLIQNIENKNKNNCDKKNMAVDNVNNEKILNSNEVYATGNSVKIETNLKNDSDENINFNSDKLVINNTSSLDNNEDNTQVILDIINVAEENVNNVEELQNDFSEVQGFKLNNDVFKMEQNAFFKESPETRKRKENHLKNLGLLTHKAAVEATIEKQRRRELFKTNIKKNGNNGCNIDAGKSNSTNGNKNSQQSTGTLKTVIKINRQANSTNSNDKRKVGISGNHGLGNNGYGGRQSLKMTFQKGRGRNTNPDKDTNNLSTNSGDDAYYTIHNETDEIHQDITSHGRKSHNRFHYIDNIHQADPLAGNEKKEEKQAIVIPEKASSFSIHPGRVCQDQCFYCGGKFGLYDTPCHVAQLKNIQKQQRILENEEKLTVDNCLCDACFRHIDRRANAIASKKRLSAPPALETISESNENLENQKNVTENDETKYCFFPNCNKQATHSVRKKFLRKVSKKALPLDFDLTTLLGLNPICDTHYETVVRHSECALCKRRLVRNHIYYITQDYGQLEKLLRAQGIPVQLRSNPTVCKLCRYFTNLLQKPPEGKTQRAQFVKSYRKRLLHFHNIQSADASDDEEESVDEKSKPTIHQPAKRGRKPKKRISDTEIKEDRTESKSPEAIETSSSQILDNEDFLGYNLTGMENSTIKSSTEQTQSKLQTILQMGSTKDNEKDDISIALRSNPNISMREIFPGEEEMGLQVSIPFGTSSNRTPEGWTKLQTTIQYDENTRLLWEELQKPYGNQSSFVKHLIMLEKFYRNGDLILSPDASTNASIYSESVQNRLQAFDVVVDPKTYNPDKSYKENLSQVLEQSNEIQQQFLNLPITITAKLKQVQNYQNAINSTPQQSSDNGSILKSNLLGGHKSAVDMVPINNNSNSNSLQMTKQERLLAAANHLVKNDDTNNQIKSIGVNKKLISNSNSPPELISINKNNSLLTSKTKNSDTQQIKQKGSISRVSITQNCIRLPDKLSAIERMQSKTWRPTLMPVTSGAHLKQSGPLYITVDGRRLPALVQVQSGGRPYLISIHDYNRMCIIRREKLLQERIPKGDYYNEQIKKSNSLTSNDSKLENIKNKKVDIPNKILEQNSVVPINRQQQIVKRQNVNKKKHPELVKNVTRLYPIAPKVNTQPQLKMLPQSIASSQQPIVLGRKGSTLGAAVSFQPNFSFTTPQPQPISTNTTSWLWNTLSNNSNDEKLNINVKPNKSISSPNATITKPQQSTSIVLDNTLLAKIPKSLTVIPQQKQQNQTNVKSVEDLTSA